MPYWVDGVDVPDFTVRVYSKTKITIYDEDGNTGNSNIALRIDDGYVASDADTEPEIKANRTSVLYFLDDLIVRENAENGNYHVQEDEIADGTNLESEQDRQNEILDNQESNNSVTIVQGSYEDDLANETATKQSDSE